jgi:hypothetical protein
METKQIDEDQLRVAKLVIVGWIKDWSCLTLMSAVSGKLIGGMDDIKKLHAKYKFLPSDWFWFYSKAGQPSSKYLKKYIADLNKKLNDALWDTEDNIKKLSFASYLATLDSTNVKSQSKYSKEDKKEHAKARRGAKGNFLAGVYNKEYAQKMNGTHWTTVK